MKISLILSGYIVFLLGIPTFAALTAPDLKEGSPAATVGSAKIEQPGMTEKEASPAEKELQAQKNKDRDAQMCLAGSRNPGLCERYKALYDCQISCRSSTGSSLVADDEEPAQADSYVSRNVDPPAASNSPAVNVDPTTATSPTVARQPAKATTPTPTTTKRKITARPADTTNEQDDSDESTPVARKAKPTEDSGETETKPETKKAQDDPTPTDDQKKQADNSDSNPASSSGSGDNGEYAAYERCNSLYSSAISACNVIDDTESASESESLTDACQQSTSKGVKSSKSKTTAANACTSAFSRCEVTCDNYAMKYSDGDYASSFSSKSSSCGALSYKVDEMLNASHSSLDLAQSGIDCTKSASESPLTAEQSAENARKARVAAEAAASICAAEPGSPGCVQAAQTAAALEAAGGLAEATSPKGQALIPDEPGEHAFTGLFTDKPASEAAKAATVPNNSGGSIPGGGGGSANTAGIEKQSLLGKIASSIADVERGFLGGGYMALLRGENPWDDSDPSKEDIDKALAALRGGDIPPRPDPIDPDLRRYLPGGDKYFPRERNPAAVSQFHGPWVDIFQRVHDRYEVICRLGLLLGCEAGWPVKF